MFMAIVTIEVQFEDEKFGEISTSQIVEDKKAVRMLFSIMPQKKQLKALGKKVIKKETKTEQPQEEVKNELVTEEHTSQQPQEA